MNLSDFLAAIPQLIGLWPRIQKALATAQSVMDSPEVKDAIATFEEVRNIIEKNGGKS
jgi:hypothetical protein